MRTGSLLLGATLAACGEPACDHALSPDVRAVGGEAAFDGYDAAGCTPDAAAYAEHVAPVVASRCGACHGEEPAYGAPSTLLAYDALIAGDPGNRPVDRMARRAATQTMPPPSSPALTHEELDLLVGWATCGEVHPDPRVGLRADAAPYAVSVPGHVDLPSFDVVADAFPVSRDTLDRYQCFAMDVPIDAPRAIRRMQVVVDDARVLHHVVLRHDPRAETAGLDAFPCDDSPVDMTQLYAWAPGTGAFDFEDGGLRIAPGERLVVEIHYNNGAGLDGVVDRSGVRLFHGPAEGTAWSLLDLGPVDFTVPRGESAVCGSTEVHAPHRLLAGMPHMHELGAEFHHWIERADGTRHDLVHLTGWSFEAQQIYDYGVDVEPGDVLRMWCGYRNETGEVQRSGLRTSDEMCFDFVFAAKR